MTSYIQIMQQTANNSDASTNGIEREDDYDQNLERGLLFCFEVVSLELIIGLKLF